MSLSSRIRKARKTVTALFGSTPIKWLLRADFDDTQAAPIPRTAEPTGALKVTDTGARASIVGGKLTINLSVGVNWGDPGIWDNTARTRAAGLMVIGALKHLTNLKRSMIGFDANQASTIDENSIHRDSAGTYAARFGGVSLTLSNTFAADVEYTEAVILRSGGAFYLVKGGAYTNWTLLFITSLQNTATLYPAYSPGDQTLNSQELDYLRCRQLPAPFSSDFGLATLHQTSGLTHLAEFEGEADGIFDFTFTLGNPIGSNALGFNYRFVNENNCWAIYLSSTGALLLNSIVGGVSTNRITVDSVFSANGTYTMRVIVQGTKHNVYTLSGTTWTKRGTEVDVSTPTLDSEKTMRVWNNLTVSPTLSALDAWPRTLSAALATELDRVEDVTWLLRDDFTTAAAAGQTVRRPAVPGPGTLTYVQKGGQMSIANGELVIPGIGGGFGEGDLGFYDSTGYARAAGLALLSEMWSGPGAFFPLLNWRNASGVNGGGGGGSIHGISREESTLWMLNRLTLIGTAASSTTYQIALVLRANGCFFLMKGGIYTNWTVLFVQLSDTTTPLFAVSSEYDGQPKHRYFRVRQLPAPFNTDYGLATLTTTTFTQSLGAELLTNGNMETGDPPTGWSAGGTPGTTVIRSFAEERTGGTGSKSIEIESNNGSDYGSANTSAVVSTGTFVELDFWRKNIDLSGGIAAFLDGALDLSDYLGTTSWNRWSKIRRSNNNYTELRIFFSIAEIGQSGLADDVSLKVVTLNAAQTATADGIFDFEFTVPASPVAGQEIHLLYRIEAAGDEFYDCWDAYLARTASNWTFNLDSISAGARTNRISVTGITGSPDTIRVICEGSLHNCYTKTGTTWTKRGSQVNVSHLNTATLINTIYSSAATPVRLTAWPRTLSAGQAAELEKV